MKKPTPTVEIAPKEVTVTILSDEDYPDFPNISVRVVEGRDVSISVGEYGYRTHLSVPDIPHFLEAVQEAYGLACKELMK